MTSVDEPPCKVIYQHVEKDGANEFSLIIDNAIEGGILIKEVVSAKGFIGGNLKALCETGRSAFTGRMVRLPSLVIRLLALKEAKL